MINIVKIGGNIIENEQKLEVFLKAFAALPLPKILVHGGGRAATHWSSKLGIDSKMLDGRRITDKKTLEIAVMVYAGLLSKKMVAYLESMDCRSIGLSGADANLIWSVKRPVKQVDYGYVGDVKEVNTEILLHLLACGITPVFNAITHDKNGQLLNTNADTIASELAVALAKEKKVQLVYVFEKEGVLSDLEKDIVIEKLDKKYYRQLKEKSIIDKGMIPKLDNCFYAMENGVEKVIIGGTKYLENEKALHTEIKI